MTRLPYRTRSQTSCCCRCCRNCCPPRARRPARPAGRGRRRPAQAAPVQTSGESARPTPAAPQQWTSYRPLSSCSRQLQPIHAKCTAALTWATARLHLGGRGWGQDRVGPEAGSAETYRDRGRVEPGIGRVEPRPALNVRSRLTIRFRMRGYPWPIRAGECLLVLHR